MIITLYSLGPGLCLKALCSRRAFSLTGYLAVVLLLDIEPWLRQSAEPVFIWSRSLPVALVAALLVISVGRSLLNPVRRAARRIIRPEEKAADLPDLNLAALISGAVAGALVSLTFAVLSGDADAPLWPFYDGALPVEPLSRWRLQRLARHFMVLALVIWGFTRMRGWK